MNSRRDGRKNGAASRYTDCPYVTVPGELIRWFRVITKRRLPREPCISHSKGLFDLRRM
jgi:hypothetical protein